jgi:hypothetical protein
MTRLFENDTCQHGIGASSMDNAERPHCGRKVIGQRRKLRKRLDGETAKLDSKIE